MIVQELEQLVVLLGEVGEVDEKPEKTKDSNIFLSKCDTLKA